MPSFRIISISNENTNLLFSFVFVLSGRMYLSIDSYAKLGGHIVHLGKTKVSSLRTNWNRDDFSDRSGVTFAGVRLWEAWGHAPPEKFEI